MVSQLLSKIIARPMTTRPSPIIVFIVLGVILPATSILWFMLSSLENQRIAADQKLKALQSHQIKIGIISFEKKWNSKLEELEKLVHRDGSKAYKALTKAPGVLSVMLWDKDGSILYPASSYADTLTHQNHTLWKQAKTLEYRENDTSRAANLYSEIISASKNKENKLAKIALSRTLYKQEKHQDSIVTLLNVFQSKTTQIDSTNERHLPSDAGLRALELLIKHEVEHDDKKIKQVTNELITLLNDYSTGNLNAHQKLQIRKYLTSIHSQLDLNAPIPTLSSEGFYFERLGNLTNLNSLPKYTGDQFYFINSKDRYFTLVVSSSYIQNTLQSTLNEFSRFNQLHVSFSRPQDSTSKRDTQILEHTLNITFDADSPRVFISNQTESKKENEITYYQYLGIGLLSLIILILSSSYATLKIKKQDKLNQLKSDVITTVSHELRTPLSSIRILVDNLLNDKGVKHEKFQEYIQIISEENARLTRLVNNFLEFSKIDRNKYNINFHHTNSGEIIDTALYHVEYRLKQKNVELDLSNINKEIELYGDAEKLAIVLVNLIDNAYKYSTPPIKISLSTIKTERHLHLSVIDNGVGISNNDKKFIFDQFYRADKNLNRSTEGCGLGLFISNYIIRNHKGKISARSTEGKGSTFTIQLPHNEK